MTVEMMSDEAKYRKNPKKPIIPQAQRHAGIRIPHHDNYDVTQ